MDASALSAASWPARVRRKIGIREIGRMRKKKKNSLKEIEKDKKNRRNSRCSN